CSLLISSFHFHSFFHLLFLHSFPTRRSSDLLFPVCYYFFNRLTLVITRNQDCYLIHFQFLHIYPSILSSPLLFTVFILNSVSTKDRKSTRLNSSHVSISYAVFCLKKKKYYVL